MPVPVTYLLSTTTPPPPHTQVDIYQLSRNWADLVKRARAKQLAPDEYSSGTFTISNLGMFGVDTFDAILPPGGLGLQGFSVGVWVCVWPGGGCAVTHSASGRMGELRCPTWSGRAVVAATAAQAVAHMRVKD